MSIFWYLGGGQALEDPGICSWSKSRDFWKWNPGIFRDLLIECIGTFYGPSWPSATALRGQNIPTVRTHLKNIVAWTSLAEKFVNIHTEKKQMKPMWIHEGDLSRHLKAHNGERSNKCMWFCIYSGRQFETTFESSQWREAKKYIRCYFTPIKAGDLKIPPLQYKFRRETFNEDTF